MGEVLLKDEATRKIWDQHQGFLQAAIRSNRATQKTSGARMTKAGKFTIDRVLRGAAAYGLMASAYISTSMNQAGYMS